MLNDKFYEMEREDLVEVDGGVAPLVAAVIAVAKVLGTCAGIGFAGGVAYEIVLGE